jgi:hypothetical protein
MATATAPAPANSTRTAPTGAAHRGPSLALLGCISVGLFVASIAVGMTMTGGTPYPTPYDPPEAARNYFGPHADVLRVGAFLQLGSAIVLGLFTATAVSRLRFHGLNVAGVTIALFGGIGAALLLMLSALTTWVMTQPGIVDDLDTLRALQLFGFAAGGPAHVAALGLLMAGVSVPSAFARLMPRWVTWLGLILAVVAELSTLTLVFPMAAVLIPLARFPAFIWIVAAGFTLPATRRAGA